jgi:hypothetical protein
MSDAGALILLAILGITIVAVYVMTEVAHCRRGHDVYDWTRKLVNWLDRKQD